jgi:uncharacterized protein (DUF1684 family)
MYEDELLAFRRQKDDFYKTSPDSPLTPEQQANFEGLRYFPPNPAYIFTVDAERLDGGAFAIDTTNGGARTYRRYARFTFVVPGREQPAALTIYETPHGFFLPFIDGTPDTYSGGRYLDLELIDETPTHARFTVDFNLAYNPYCAFSDGWSCPIVPIENRIDAWIPAGERAWDAEELPEVDL